MLNKIFVCSRYRATETHSLEEHTQLAKDYAHFVLTNRYGAPFVPHLLYPLFLDDSVLSEREAGINAGLAFLATCDACFVFLEPDGGLSDGMTHEIRYAIQKGIMLVVFDHIDDAYVRNDTALNLWLLDRVLRSK